MQLEPIVSFAILLAVILIVPLLFEKFRLPGLLGLLVAGVCLGPNGLDVLNSESETMKLLSDIGLVYLMFVAGLEVDLAQFKATKNRSMGFGFLTFIVPLITGTAVGFVFGFGWNPAILIGSLFASHTLLAYPIVSRLGVVKNEAVTVTIGATIFTDIGALLVLAVCVGIHEGDFSTLSLIRLLTLLAVYSSLILFGFSWLGREFFRRSGDEEGNQFLFVLLVVFISALGAEVIGVEKIVGAFLAGLAVNSAIGEGPVEEKVIFVGNVLFIPIFFVDLGLLINLPAFLKSLGAIGMAITIVIGLISSKFGAAFIARWLYRYSWREMITMWSLSMPQVAATLAATLVGYRAGLLTEDVLNSVIVLMLVTATIGPIITARSAIGLVPYEAARLEPQNLLPDWDEETTERTLTVVVPVYNPQTERYLIEMAALLVKNQTGQIVPLAVTTAHVHMDDPDLDGALKRSQMLLQTASDLGNELGVQATPLLRIDDSIAQGISRASREQDANLIVMGWGVTTGLRARLFGNVIDSVLWASHCPVAVTRLLDSPKNIHRILVPIENLSLQAVRTARFAEILAEANHAKVTVLHVCDRQLAGSRRQLETQLATILEKCSPGSKATIRIVAGDDVAKVILRMSRAFDLVVLRSLRRRLGIGELAISTVTTEIVKQIQCSFVVLGEPQRHHTGLMLTKRQTH